MIKRLFIISIFSLLFVSQSLATPQTTVLTIEDIQEQFLSQPVTMELYINMALKSSPLVGKVWSDYIAAVESSLEAEGQFDWNIFMNTSYSRGYSQFGTYTGDVSVYSTEAGIRKQYATTGTSISFSSGYSLSEDLPVYFAGMNSTQHEAPMDLTIKQPLFQNAFGRLDRYPLLRGAYIRDLSELKVQEDFEDLVVYYTDQFLIWAQSYLDVKYGKEQLKKAEEQLAVVKRQFKKGAAESLDVAQAKQNFVAKKISLLSARRQFLSLTQSALAYINIEAPEDISSLELSFDALEIPSVSHEDGLHIAHHSSHTKRLFELNEILENISVSENIELIKPELNLVFQHTREPITDGFSDLVDEIGGSPTYYVGLEFSKPLFNTESKKRAASSYASYTSVSQQNEEDFKNYIIAINSYYQQLKDVDGLIQETEKLVKISKEYEALEKQKYDQGRTSSLTFLLAAQDQTLNAELQLEKLKIETLNLQNALAGLLDLYGAHYQVIKGKLDGRNY